MRDTWTFIRKIVERGDVIIDVGAHIGSYAIPIANMISQSGLVVAIEPSPIIRYLKENAQINGLKNIIILQKVAYSSRCSVSFKFNALDPLISGLSSTSNGNNIKLIAEPLDEMLSELSISPKQRYKLLIMDVEGAEAEVLKGAYHTIKNTEYVIVEVRRNNMENVKEILSDFQIFETNDRYGIGGIDESVNLIAKRIKAC